MIFAKKNKEVFAILNSCKHGKLTLLGTITMIHLLFQNWCICSLNEHSTKPILIQDNQAHSIIVSFNLERNTLICNILQGVYNIICFNSLNTNLNKSI